MVNKFTRFKVAQVVVFQTQRDKALLLEVLWLLMRTSVAGNPTVIDINTTNEITAFIMAR
jgi:hypothetical protein